MVRKVLVLCGLLCAGSAEGDLARIKAPALGQPCDDLDAKALGAALDRQMRELREQAPAPDLRFGPRFVTMAEYIEGTLQPLSALSRRGRAALCSELPRRFWFFRSGDGQGKFTAYHHPVFRGSRRRRGAYRHPLYRRPEDGALAHLQTAQILKGGLGGRGLEIVWLEDGTAALMAHIEGSARIELVEGGALNLTTHGHNGWPYESVARFVLRDGKLPKGLVAPPGMTRVQKYLQDHPDELIAYWGKNPHFVFFRETELSGTGKFGELVPGRSAAVDPQEVPLGAALWLRTGPLRRIGLAQDVGAAIKGPGRVDLFLGTGDEAQQAAVALNRPGELYVLLAAPAKARRPIKGRAAEKR